MKTETETPPQPPPIASRVAAQNVRILLERQKAGKPLSRSEIAQVEKYFADQNGAAPKEQFAKSLQDLAGIFHTNRETIRLWLKAGAPRPTGSGFYPINAWREWVRENGKEVDEAETLDKARLTCRQIQLKIEKMEIEVAQAKGELMHVDDVRRCLFQSFDTVRRLQLRMGTALASRLAGLEPAEIEREITAALEDTYAAIQQWAEKMARTESTETTAPTPVPPRKPRKPRTRKIKP
jgi:hypothetical protein